MTRGEIARRRLANQFLLDRPHATPTDVVAALGAVQAQDYPGAKWGVAQRARGLTDADLDRALADGSIVRTHVLRPTWHLVAREDIRWMLGLSAPRLLSGMRARHRQLEIDDPLRRRANALLAKALRDGRHLTRNEIAAVFTQARIDVRDRQRLAHLLYLAELEMLVCSGPPRGKQLTYALFDERVPARPPRPREEAVAELVRRYFSTRGPATVHDFAWWSGLTTGDAKRALAAMEGEFEHMAIDGRSYWFSGAKPEKARTPRAHLLPNYDEFFIGFKDRSASLVAAQREGVEEAALSIFAHVVFIDGQVAGSWRRTLSSRGVVLDISLLFAPSGAAQRAIDAEVKRFGEFISLAASVA